MSAVRLARGFRCAAIVKPAASYRPFTVSAVSRKTFVDSTKDAARVVDRTVADAAAKGIEKGEEAASAVKATINKVTGQAEGKSAEVEGRTRGSAAETAGQVKETASELKGEAKGKAHEVAGKVKGKVEEARQKL